MVVHELSSATEGDNTLTLLFQFPYGWSTLLLSTNLFYRCTKPKLSWSSCRGAWIQTHKIFWSLSFQVRLTLFIPNFFVRFVPTRRNHLAIRTSPTQHLLQSITPYLIPAIAIHSALSLDQTKHSLHGSVLIWSTIYSKYVLFKLQLS